MKLKDMENLLNQLLLCNLLEMNGFSQVCIGLAAICIFL